MPEGHVIHRLAGEIRQRFAGQPVRVTSPQGRFADAASLLDGTVLADAQAWGKHLFLDFSPTAELAGNSLGAGPLVQIHLGLIGKLRWLEPGAVVAADTLRLRIEDREQALELRGPQTCALLTGAEAAAVIAGLGPDPLRAEADPEAGWRRVHRSGRTIGSLLLDQRVAAGVGNIYRAEVLFRQRIHPDTPGERLSVRAWRRIWADLVELMPHGVSDGRIDTVRPEHTPEAMGREPRVDAHGGEVYVYRRAGQPCLVCGTEVRVREFEGRNLYWCGKCQRKR